MGGRIASIYGEIHILVDVLAPPCKVTSPQFVNALERAGEIADELRDLLLLDRVAELRERTPQQADVERLRGMLARVARDMEPPPEVMERLEQEMSRSAKR